MIRAHLTEKDDSGAARWFTENVEERSGGDGWDAAAAERRLTLVVTAVADRGQADDQPAAEVADARADHRSVFPPRDAHFDERSGRGEMKGRGGGEQQAVQRMLFLIWLHFKVTQCRGSDGEHLSF